MKRTCITRRQLLAFTGAPGQRFEGRRLGTTHYTHPQAKTIRFVESGYDPRGSFPMCDNTLLRAESIAAGSADLSRIEVVGQALSPVQGFPK